MELFTLADETVEPFAHGSRTYFKVVNFTGEPTYYGSYANAELAAKRWVSAPGRHAQVWMYFPGCTAGMAWFEFVDGEPRMTENHMAYRKS